MTVLLATHPVFLEHVTGPHHPERPSRLAAVARGCADASRAGRLTPIEPRTATRSELELVHPAWYLDRLDAIADRRRRLDRRRHQRQRGVGTGGSDGRRRRA